MGVEASLRALEELSAGGTAQRAALSRKLEQLVYEAKKAFEQYDAVDARNRLAASELERRKSGPFSPPALPSFDGVGSEEARSIALALASVRRSNWACSFPAPSFHEDAAR